ncbi:MAG: hypothetical protein HW421_978 [Ignavibacteria bacterium]|nr:hypothetical protein [Ignavibacteria bacterium]
MSKGKKLILIIISIFGIIGIITTSVIATLYFTNNLDLNSSNKSILPRIEILYESSVHQGFGNTTKFISVQNKSNYYGYAAIDNYPYYFNPWEIKSIEIYLTRYEARTGTQIKPITNEEYEKYYKKK